MFQIIFPMPLGTDVLKIKDVMPVGWTVEEVGVGWLNIHNRLSGDWVGVIKVHPEKIVIKVVETDPQGEAFWRAFGMRYSEFNPFDLRFGVLYLPSGEGNLWELDEFPKHDPNRVLEDVSHYANAARACYVSFRFGNWHPGEEILVTSCQEINRDGKLGSNQGAAFFLLGNIENDSTM